MICKNGRVFTPSFLCANKDVFFFVAYSDTLYNVNMKETQKQAEKRYHKANYDTLLIRTPKGTKNAILRTGDSVNNYCKVAILDRLQGKTQTETITTATEQPQQQITDVTINYDYMDMP